MKKTNKNKLILTFFTFLVFSLSFNQVLFAYDIAGALKGLWSNMNMNYILFDSGNTRIYEFDPFNKTSTRKDYMTVLREIDDDYGFVKDSVTYHTDNSFVTSNWANMSIVQHVPRYKNQDNFDCSEDEFTGGYSDIFRTLACMGKDSWAFRGDVSVNIKRCSRCEVGSGSFSNWSSQGMYAQPVITKSKSSVWQPYGPTGWFKAEYKNPFIAKSDSKARVHLFNKAHFNTRNKNDSDNYEEKITGTISLGKKRLVLQDHIKSLIIGRNTIVNLYDDDNYEGEPFEIEGPTAMATVPWNIERSESLKGYRWDNDF